MRPDMAFACVFRKWGMGHDKLFQLCVCVHVCVCVHGMGTALSNYQMDPQSAAQQTNTIILTVK